MATIFPRQTGRKQGTVRVPDPPGRIFFPEFVFLCLFTVVMPATAQHRYLVSPPNEVVPLGDGESALDKLRNHSGRRTADGGAYCEDDFQDGYAPGMYPTTHIFKTFHRDIVGQWYVAPASGRIDTIFWRNLGDVDICHGEAYWVKVAGDGYLFMSCDGADPGARSGPDGLAAPKR